MPFFIKSFLISKEFKYLNCVNEKPYIKLKFYNDKKWYYIKNALSV